MRFFSKCSFSFLVILIVWTFFFRFCFKSFLLYGSVFFEIFVYASLSFFREHFLYKILNNICNFVNISSTCPPGGNKVDGLPPASSLGPRHDFFDRVFNL